ncbi:MAG: type II secretion system F family protein [Pirellulaceae bacterium]
MSWFEFEVEDCEGRLVKGKIEADTVGSAAAKLEAEGNSVLSLNRISDGESSQLSATTRPAEIEWKSRITAQLKMREHWLPGLRAFQHELPSGAVRKEISSIISELGRENVDAADLLDTPHLIALLPLLSEKQETLSSERLHDWVTRRQAFGSAKLHFWKSLSYPLALAVGGLFLFALFSLFLIPFFKELYIEFGLHLPASTRWLIWISDAFSERPSIMLLGIALLGLATTGVVLGWRNLALTNRILGIFIAGTTSNLRCMSRVAETVAELLRFGAPVDESLRIAASHASHRMYANACRNLADCVANEKALSSRDPSISCLPPLLLTALQVSDSSGPSVPMLQTVASIYAERINSRVEWLHSLIPPAAILFIGGCVAFVILSLLLPLFTLISALA